MKHFLFIIYLSIFGQTILYAQADSLATIEEEYFDVNTQILPPPQNQYEMPHAINLMEVQRLIEYPQSAKDAGIKGKLRFRVLVDENGKYIKHQAPENGEAILIKEVERHIAKLRFEPFIKDGKAIKYWIRIPFNFELTD